MYFFLGRIPSLDHDTRVLHSLITNEFPPLLLQLQDLFRRPHFEYTLLFFLMLVILKELGGLLILVEAHSSN